MGMLTWAPGASNYSHSSTSRLDGTLDGAGDAELMVWAAMRCVVVSVPGGQHQWS
jgi:hypothetical protein